MRVVVFQVDAVVSGQHEVWPQRVLQGQTDSLRVAFYEPAGSFIHSVGVWVRSSFYNSDIFALLVHSFRCHEVPPIQDNLASPEAAKTVQNLRKPAVPERRFGHILPGSVVRLQPDVGYSAYRYDNVVFPVFDRNSHEMLRKTVQRHGLAKNYLAETHRRKRKRLLY